MMNRYGRLDVSDSAVQKLIEDNEDMIITADEATSDGEIQGISWPSVSPPLSRNSKRNDFRAARSNYFRNHEDVRGSGRRANQLPSVTPRKGTYYDFWQYTKLEPNFMNVHKVNNNLVWSTSKHDVYIPSRCDIKHWSGITSNSTNVVNFLEPVVPTEVNPQMVAEGFQDVRVYAMSIGFNLLTVVGKRGELICKRLDRIGISSCHNLDVGEQENIDADRRATTEICRNQRNDICFTASCRSRSLSIFETERFELLNTFELNWHIHHTSMSPNGRSILVVGEHKKAKLLDSETGQITATLSGHRDYSISCAWHPNGNYCATGNQDKTCRIWDVRNTANSLHILKGNMASICSMRFTSDGEYMAMGESADFVHVYDVNQNFESSQVIDFFGYVSGLSFSPDKQSLFIGVAPEDKHTSLLWFNKSRNLEPYQFIYQ